MNRILNFFYLIFNIILLTLILIRDPNELSFQENLGYIGIFNNISFLKKIIDQILPLLVFIFFLTNYILNLVSYRK